MVDEVFGEVEAIGFFRSNQIANFYIFYKEMYKYIIFFINEDR